MVVIDLSLSFRALAVGHVPPNAVRRPYAGYVCQKFAAQSEAITAAQDSLPNSWHIPGKHESEVPDVCGHGGSVAGTGRFGPIGALVDGDTDDGGTGRRVAGGVLVWALSADGVVSRQEG
jgi:hypothetical protein